VEPIVFESGASFELPRHEDDQVNVVGCHGTNTLFACLKWLVCLLGSIGGVSSVGGFSSIGGLASFSRLFCVQVV